MLTLPGGSGSGRDSAVRRSRPSTECSASCRDAPVCRHPSSPASFQRSSYPPSQSVPPPSLHGVTVGSQPPSLLGGQRSESHGVPANGTWVIRSGPALLGSRTRVPGLLHFWNHRAPGASR